MPRRVFWSISWRGADIFGVVQMTITLTREEAQQVLDALGDSIDAQQWELDDHITKFGEGYKPHRVKYMREQLANTNSTIETLRTRLAQPEQRTGGCLLTGVCAAEGHRIQKARREWQGLEIDEVKATAELGIYEKPLIDFARAIEAKLKEKNT